MYPFMSTAHMEIRQSYVCFLDFGNYEVITSATVTYAVFRDYDEIKSDK